MKLSQFEIQVDGRAITCLLGEPDSVDQLAADPAVLLNFATDRRTVMCQSPYDIPSGVFVEAGHRMLSFDLPNHGSRIAPWKADGIAGFCESFLAGVDPFKIFVADGKAAIDAILERGSARFGRIFLAGNSRGGYCALRLAAADPRVNGVAAFSPVTDWRALSEFANAKDRLDVAALALEHFAEALAGRAIFCAIGNTDRRVGSDRCARFATRLLEIEAERGLAHSRLCFHLLDGQAGHSLSEPWRKAGAEFLLRQIA